MFLHRFTVITSLFISTSMCVPEMQLIHCGNTMGRKMSQVDSISVEANQVKSLAGSVPIGSIGLQVKAGPCPAKWCDPTAFHAGV